MPLFLSLLQVQDELWPFGIYFGLVILIASAMLLLSSVLGERHRETATGQPYESGILPTGTARVRFNAAFYLVAIDFVLFDVEVMFLVAWAVALRETGWTGYLAMLAFTGVLLLSLLYLWRAGGLDWGRRRRGRVAAAALPGGERAPRANSYQ